MKNVLVAGGLFLFVSGVYAYTIRQMATVRGLDLRSMDLLDRVFPRRRGTWRRFSKKSTSLGRQKRQPMSWLPSTLVPRTRPSTRTLRRQPRARGRENSTT
jgi:hypothetical protein